MTLELDHVAFHYWRRTVLDGLSWTIDGPAVVGLLGPNGAGKTTLMRLLSTSLRPAAGTLRYRGAPLDRDRKAQAAYRRKLGYLPQDLGFYPSFTAREYVTYIAWLRGMEPREARYPVAAALESLGISDLSNAKLRTLSGGQLRRVGIAQAIVNQPDVLLLDEPTAGLDPGQRLHFRQLLRRFGESHIVVVSTHLVEDVAAACNHVAVLKEGRIVFRGTPTDLEHQAHGGSLDEASDIEQGYLATLD